MTTGGGHPELVVDVVNNNTTTIKDEFVHSPQHGSRSINGTPSSTSSLITPDNPPIEIITTDGLKTEMYNSHMFTAMSQPQGSGTPSPIPYSDHATQYTTSVSQVQVSWLLLVVHLESQISNLKCLKHLGYPCFIIIITFRELSQIQASMFYCPLLTSIMRTIIGFPV